MTTRHRIGRLARCPSTVHLLLTSRAYPQYVRDAFGGQLDAVVADLAIMCRSVERAVDRASRALLDGDEMLAEEVINGDADADAARERVEDRCTALLSPQHPVTGDLRVVVSALRIVGELERIEDHAGHIARIARLRAPGVAVPDELRPGVARMAEVAHDMVSRAARVVTDRDVEAAAALHRDEVEMDRLRRESFGDLHGGDWSHGVEAAVDVAMLGRYYEQIADHAASVANRMVFVVTGEQPADA